MHQEGFLNYVQLSLEGGKTVNHNIVLPKPLVWMIREKLAMYKLD